MKECESCKYSREDWANPLNTDHYCGNIRSDNYGCNTEDVTHCDNQVERKTDGQN